MSCQPCGDAAPNVYSSVSGEHAGIYLVKNWTPLTANGSASNVCEFDRTGAGATLFGCSTCAIDDIAATNQGTLLVTGRRNSTSGYLLLLDPADQTMWQPCKYRTLTDQLRRLMILNQQVVEQPVVWSVLATCTSSEQFFCGGGG